MTQTHVFTHTQAKRYYDWMGAKLDTQSFYEAPPQRDLAAHLSLKTCRAIVEFGCGTARFAAELLSGEVPPKATYLGIDVSATMVDLSRKRLAKFGDRASVKQSDGTPHIDAPDGAFDRFICSYVLELLTEDEIQAVLAEAHRVLEPGGLLGITVLTSGPTTASGAVSTIWSALHRLSPWIVGGCRPIELRPRIPLDAWRIVYRNCLTPVVVPSEIVVAQRLP
ncbi:MAG: methyltransferase domain-containing protein [Alphaproteobacteria bacterium]|nr:methyltransferase domain-containing protein [Alphaproteobacteria bacterium]